MRDVALDFISVFQKSCQRQDLFEKLHGCRILPTIPLDDGAVVEHDGALSHKEECRLAGLLRGRVLLSQETECEVAVAESGGSTSSTYSLFGSFRKEEKVSSQGLDLLDELAKRTIAEVAVQNHVYCYLSQRELGL